MPRKLDVYLHRDLVGQLLQDEHGLISFSYGDDWLRRSEAKALSHSLPLQPGKFNRKACQAFFAGILPDENKREVIAKNLGISAGNDFAMLEQLGGECAGAVTFLPVGAGLPERDDHYRPLSSEKLADIRRQLPRRPLLAGEDGIRLSLAGAQDKIAVHIKGDQVSLPLGGAPSTHILKPAIARFEGVVFNEAFCLQLAQAAGLPAARAEQRRVEDIDYLLVQRYDRRVVPGIAGGHEQLERLHQEDFCQALGIAPNRKYQSEGGPALKQCFELLRELSASPVVDLQCLLDAVIYNFLVGNHDAHGKNFSLLYGQNTRLAPLYDVLSTIYYPDLSKKMAMKIGREYFSDEVTPRQFEKLAEEAGLAKQMAKQRVLELAEVLLEKIPGLLTDQPTTKAVAALVQNRCAKVREQFHVR